MKKSISILLSLLILISTTGFSVNTHYCANKVTTTISFDTYQKSCCGKTEVMPNNCCKDVSKFVKFDQKYTTTQIINVPGLKILDVCLFFIDVTAFFTDISNIPAISFPEKPPLISIPFMLLYSVFLI